jgi:phage host-nuclease inhibitor protein Gam
VYVKVNKSGNYFFVLNKANTEKACAARTFSLTEEWKTYTIDFDLTKVVNTINTPKVAADGTQPIAASTKEDLANFFAAFVATTEEVTYYIDDVTMIEIEK